MHLGSRAACGHRNMRTFAVGPSSTPCVKMAVAAPKVQTWMGRLMLISSYWAMAPANKPAPRAREAVWGLNTKP